MTTQDLLRTQIAPCALIVAQPTLFRIQDLMEQGGAKHMPKSQMLMAYR